LQSKIAQSNILQSIGLVDHHLSNRYVFIMPYLHASNSRQPNLPSWVMLYTLLLGLVWCYVKWFKGGFFCGGDSQCSDILVRSLEDSLHKGLAIALTIVADWKRKEDDQHAYWKLKSWLVVVVLVTDCLTIKSAATHVALSTILFCKKIVKCLTNVTCLSWNLQSPWNKATHEMKVHLFWNGPIRRALPYTNCNWVPTTNQNEQVSTHDLWKGY
jgi:hypothetical protein